jgi:hypothetical protein
MCVEGSGGIKTASACRKGLRINLQGELNYI